MATPEEVAVFGAVKDLREARAPTTIRVLPQRPAFWAALFIAAGNSIPNKWVASVVIWSCVLFIIAWQTRVRRDYRDWRKARETHEMHTTILK